MESRPLRDARWLTPQRARAYARILLATAGAVVALWLALSPGGLDPTGKPLGTDFLSFWAASKLALQGGAAAAYDLHAHAAAQAALFGDVGYAAFFYPPTFLLICLPLALLPYLGALAAWLLATGAAYALTIRRALGASLGRADAWTAALAFPAGLANLGHGQNGFLSAALMGAGAMSLARRPWLAGVLFGLLAFKPHLALILPVALLARGAWRTMIAGAATALAFAALSWAVLGSGAWAGFLHTAPAARAALEQDWVGPAKMVSAFAGARLLGADVGAAYAVQLGWAALAAAGLWRLARRGAPEAVQAAALCTAALMASPFLLDYDLTLLAVPLALLFAQAKREGFRPYEKAALGFAFLTPLIARSAAASAHLPLGALAVGLTFLMAVRRGEAEQSASAALTPWFSPTPIRGGRS